MYAENGENVCDELLLFLRLQCPKSGMDAMRHARDAAFKAATTTPFSPAYCPDGAAQLVGECLTYSTREVKISERRGIWSRRGFALWVDIYHMCVLSGRYMYVHASTMQLFEAKEKQGERPSCVCL